MVIKSLNNHIERMKCVFGEENSGIEQKIRKYMINRFLNMYMLGSK